MDFAYLLLLAVLVLAAYGFLLGCAVLMGPRQ
jgi:hypothetical protein